MSRHREPDQLAGASHYQQLEFEAWLLGTAVPETLGAELLARSDAATVYRVVGPDMSSLVVKILSPERLAGLRATFDRVGAHTALVPMRASGIEQPHGYAVFPFYAQTLADRIEAGAIATADLGQLLSPVADALALLHRAGIVHADVKPSNIMLTAAGNAVLADLDEAGELGSIPRRVTVGFCPPEQLTGQPLAVANDSFAFASTVLTALTGSTAWMADPAGWLASPAAGELAVPVADALRSALSVDPSARQAHPRQLAAALLAEHPAGHPTGRAVQHLVEKPDQPGTLSQATAAMPVQQSRQVLAPVLAGAPPTDPAAGSPVATASKAADPPPLTELVAAAQQVWGFGDLRAVTVDRLILQLQPPPAEPEEVAADRPIWRHPAMIVSMALAAVLILIGIGLTIFS
ncbi:MAG: hypothetical protein ABI140_22235 [Jatrophihabitantaceae bacterium]